VAQRLKGQAHERRSWQSNSRATAVLALSLSALWSGPSDGYGGYSTPQYLQIAGDSRRVIRCLLMLHRERV
jgi:hypothetical protein